MKRPKSNWLKHSLYWVVEGELYVSIPFTWELPIVRKYIGFYPHVWVGGPAIELMPNYFADLEHVDVGTAIQPDVLQRMNPLATRTTAGCIRHCRFCGVGERRIEGGGFRELPDWPDLPIIADNNLLAASLDHFDKVLNRLEHWQWADFEQGLDARLLTEYHAERIARLRKPTVRLALDSIAFQESWQIAYERLRAAGIAKQNIRSYALIGFDSDPGEAWSRCKWIESLGVDALPMWFHELDALKLNQVTDKQKKLGWNEYERQKIMGWFYKHRMPRKKAVV